MKKVRLYELAKELDLESKVLVEFLLDLGAEVKNHMSTVEEDIAGLVREHFQPEPEEAVVEAGSDHLAKNRSRRTQAKDERKEEMAAKNRKSNGRKKTRGRQGGTQQKVQPAPPKPKAVSLELPDSIILKELAARTGIAPAKLIKKLMDSGIMATVTQSIDYATAELVCSEFGITVRPVKDLAESVFEDIADEEEAMQHRPPVVTIMGHVDHGKTTLLDGIRTTRVTATEAGGITQHIGAYQVMYKDKKITFLDTPGHAAFTAMRSRGAQVTDIAILVVAADDGVMPQTVEAINHAKAAGVPIIVAVNKIDKPGANPDRVKQELTEHELVAEEWGGNTIFVPISALHLEGIDDLLEMILLVSEMEEFRANADRLARGTVIEAELDKGRGPVATVLISSGTLRVGDSFVVGTHHGRVRALLDDQGKTVDRAVPSQPVEILGCSGVPSAGDLFVAVPDEQTARQVAEITSGKQREADLTPSSRVNLDDLFAQIKEGDVQELNVIIKADVQGSAEALRSSLEKLSTDEVRIRVIHQGVGAVNESDVSLAAASNAIIIGFNIRPEPNARRAAEREGVDIRSYRIIYNVIDDIKAAMSGLLAPDFVEETLGQAEVRQTFKVPGSGIVAGCYVIDGKVTRQAQVRILRDSVVIHEGQISSLRRFKDDVREVAQGYECGIGIERFNDVKEGDVIEAYVMKEVQRQL